MQTCALKMSRIAISNFVSEDCGSVGKQLAKLGTFARDV